MSESEPPRIEFPCDYPIKIFLEGNDSAAVDRVLETVGVHVDGFDPLQAELRPSRNGRFLAVSIEIVATGEAQLKALHADLLAHEQVRLVL